MPDDGVPAWVTDECAFPPRPFRLYLSRARHRVRQRRYAARVFAVVDFLRDGPCSVCGARGGRMELAHVAPTGVAGRSRGKMTRALDVLRHPESYVLACWRCNRSMDRGRRA